MSQLDQVTHDLMSIDGATGAAVVDYGSGMALASAGDPGFNLDVAAAGNSNVVRAKLATLRDIGLTSKIDDILITLEDEYHLINVLGQSGAEGLFLYLVLRRDRANLALARFKLNQVSSKVHV